MPVVYDARDMVAVPLVSSLSRGSVFVLGAPVAKVLA